MFNSNGFVHERIIISKFIKNTKMILSNEDIKKCLKTGEIEFEPPVPDEQISPGSVDVTLGNEFRIIKKEFYGKILDLKNTGSKDVTEKIIVDEIELKPGGMVLGKTVEKIKLSSDIAGWIEGRSRFARLGVAIHVTSGYIQPGSHNHQVLEIVNLAPFSIVLHSGMRLCQVVFERLESKTSKPYHKFGTIAREQ